MAGENKGEETPGTPAAQPPVPGATPTPAAPAAGGDGGEKPAAAPAAAGLSPEERQELEQLRSTSKKWDEERKDWEAVKPYLRKAEDGSLELDPKLLPPSAPAAAAAPEDEDPEAAATAKRRAETETIADQKARKVAELLQRDTDIERRLADENKADPVVGKVMSKVRELIQKVPLERRDEKAWRNALVMARGLCHEDYREHWRKDGAQQAESDLVKAHGLRIPKSVPKKTDEELVSELTDEQRRAADQMGIPHKNYARRLDQMKSKGGR